MKIRKNYYCALPIHDIVDGIQHKMMGVSTNFIRKLFDRVCHGVKLKKNPLTLKNKWQQKLL